MAEILSTQNNSTTLIFDERAEQEWAMYNQSAINRQIARTTPMIPFSNDRKMEILSEAINAHPVFNNIMNAISGTPAYISPNELNSLIVEQYMQIDDATENLSIAKGMPVIDATVLSKVIVSVKDIAIDSVQNGVRLTASGELDHVASAVQLAEMYGVTVQQALIIQKEAMQSETSLETGRIPFERLSNPFLEEICLGADKSTFISLIGGRGEISEADRITREIIAGMSDEAVRRMDISTKEDLAKKTGDIGLWLDQFSEKDIPLSSIRYELEAEILEQLYSINITSELEFSPEQRFEIEQLITNRYNKELLERQKLGKPLIKSPVLSEMMDGNGQFKFDLIQGKAKRFLKEYNNFRMMNNLLEYEEDYSENGFKVTELSYEEIEKLMRDLMEMTRSDNPVIKHGFYKVLLPMIKNADGSQIFQIDDGERLTEQEVFDVIKDWNGEYYESLFDPRFIALCNSKKMTEENAPDKLNDIRESIQRVGEIYSNKLDKGSEYETLSKDALQVYQNGGLRHNSIQDYISTYIYSKEQKIAQEKDMFSYQRNEIYAEMDDVAKGKDPGTAEASLIETYLQLFRREFLLSEGKLPETVDDYQKRFDLSATCVSAKKYLEQKGLYRKLLSEDGIIDLYKIEEYDKLFSQRALRQIKRNVDTIEKVSRIGILEDIKKDKKINELLEISKKYETRRGTLRSPKRIEERTPAEKQADVEKMFEILYELPYYVLTSSRIHKAINVSHLDVEARKALNSYVGKQRDKHYEEIKAIRESKLSEKGKTELSREELMGPRASKKRDVFKRYVNAMQHLKRNIEVRVSERTGIGLKHLENGQDSLSLVDVNGRGYKFYRFFMDRLWSDSEGRAVQTLKRNYLRDKTDDPGYVVKRKKSVKVRGIKEDIIVKNHNNVRNRGVEAHLEEFRQGFEEIRQQRQQEIARMTRMIQNAKIGGIHEEASQATIPPQKEETRFVINGQNLSTDDVAAGIEENSKPRTIINKKESFDIYKYITAPAYYTDSTIVNVVEDEKKKIEQEEVPELPTGEPFDIIKNETKVEQERDAVMKQVERDRQIADETFKRMQEEQQVQQQPEVIKQTEQQPVVVPVEQKQPEVVKQEQLKEEPVKQNDEEQKNNEQESTEKLKKSRIKKVSKSKEAKADTAMQKYEEKKKSFEDYLAVGDDVKKNIQKASNSARNPQKSKTEDIYSPDPHGINSHHKEENEDEEKDQEQ